MLFRIISVADNETGSYLVSDFVYHFQLQEKDGVSYANFQEPHKCSIALCADLLQH